MHFKKALCSFLALLLLLLTTATAFGEEALDLSKTYNITYYHNGNGQGRYPDDQDEILAVLNKKFNIDLRLNIVDSEYVSKLNLQVASGSIPDIMQVDAEQFRSYLAQGLLLPLEDYVAKMPNFMATYPNVLTDATLRVDGHLYFLAGNKPAEQVVKSYSSLWIRKDWLDKLGLAIPTTLDELKDVAIAFTQNDPDGNGVNDTFGYSGMGAASTLYNALNPFLGAFGVGREAYQLSDGKLVYSPTMNEYADALAWFADFIATGAVDPDIMIMNTFDQIREKVYRNQVGLIYFSWAEFIKPPYNQTLAEMTPDAEWIQINPPVGPAGSYDSAYNVPGSMNSGRVLSIDLAGDPEKLERVLAYLDYIVAGEGNNLVCYGIEGKHFNIVDGKIVATDLISQVSYAWQHQIMGRNEPVYLSTKFPTCQKQIAFAAELPRIDSYNNFVSTPEGLNNSDMNRFVEEEMIRFLYGKRDISTFDEYVSTLYDVYGLQQYLDIGTANLTAAGII